MPVIEFKLDNFYFSDTPELVTPFYRPVDHLTLTDDQFDDHGFTPDGLDRLCSHFHTDSIRPPHQLTGTSGYFYAPRYDHTHRSDTQTCDIDQLEVVVLLRYKWSAVGDN